MRDLRSHNPKYPTLVGTKLAALLALILRQLNRLAELERALLAAEHAHREHREKWARRPPRNIERDWFDFWLDEAALFDDVVDVRDQIAVTRETMRRLVMEAMDIVNQNGMNVTGTGTIRELEQLLALAISLSENGEREEEE